MCVHLLMENWDLWQRRIIVYSHLEKTNRKKLKDIGQLDKTSDEINGEYISGTFTCDVLDIWL